MVHDFLAALRGKLSHEDLSVYNAVQKLLYLGVLLRRRRDRALGPVDLEAGPVAVADGFFGGYNTARYVHFVAMTAIVAFMVVHVVLAILVPKSLRAMIIGR